MRIGDRVFWEDPDAGGYIGIGTVVSLQCEPVAEGTVIGIDMDDGRFVEAFRDELRSSLATDAEYTRGPSGFCGDRPPGGRCRGDMLSCIDKQQAPLITAGQLRT